MDNCLLRCLPPMPKPVHTVLCLAGSCLYLRFVWLRACSEEQRPIPLGVGVILDWSLIFIFAGLAQRVYQIAEHHRYMHRHEAQQSVLRTEHSEDCSLGAVRSSRPYATCWYIGPKTVHRGRLFHQGRCVARSRNETSGNELEIQANKPPERRCLICRKLAFHCKTDAH